ncbi:MULTISPECIES: TatD family hydrolase [Methylomonas]|uniref:Deoxyribonuclease n=2 Tax=Methylomonas TaxID=416 RepID=A0A126T8S8_9GAMM|nr:MULTISPECIES: TatD family hydrolase [Methylomonas]AMK78174.1 deoxyribonuclease [Methylomonas denitrificans]OAI03896.1 deoxyribonuclease [Methylomonas methanica]TCV87798.1 TatD DNase family protein [Methylomonas methanica]
MKIETGLEALSLTDGYIDIHCHQTGANQTLEIISIGTQDFDLAATQIGFYSLGLHPWHLDQEDIETALGKISAASLDPNLVAIGECGLDKAIATPLTLQTTVFVSQIELASQLGKPLIIHCVRAFNELTRIKKSTPNAEIPWIIHGFNGNPALAEQLIRHGFYLSFGAALLNPLSHAGETLLSTPVDRLFLETDAANVSIDAIYAAAAKMLGLDIASLRQQILSNFKRVFLND